ncbi:MAG: chemotaxis protein CheW [Candidatus Sedimenticola sp. 4PFRAG1]
MATATSADILLQLREIERRSMRHAEGLPKEDEGTQFWEGVLCSVAGVRMVAPLGEIAEILNYPASITAVPGTKNWVVGIANIRGNLLPIIDLQVFLGGKHIVTGRRSRVLVINHNGLYVGLLVGDVHGMRHFAEDQGAAVPDLPGVVRQYVRQAYSLENEVWPVFSTQLLAENQGFQVAAA